MTILITGASGRTSGYVIEALLASSPTSDLRLLVRSEVAIQKLTAKYPGLKPANFAIGDLLEPSTIGPAVAGIDVIFHNGPSFIPNETAMGIALIEAAKAAGVKHFVFCSVLHPILTKLLNHKAKRDIEEYLIDLSATLQSSVISAAWNPKTWQGYLDLHDLAEVAAKVILDPAPHNLSRYELCGQNCTIEDVARELSAHIGKKIAIKNISSEEALAHFGQSGGYGVEAGDRMLYYYNKRGIPGNTNVLRWLLGREPTTWKALFQL
ncbi:NAD(P)-binding protein [Daedalea quercina L-15889]|uniref:NAD(P)-binding protein n=1 Tax=Daedalea quercina L-15889 TaxID=1314783 RepID=A0A165SCF1_9APHY|nr:NAD(P)-binding protein [Daedalea quercina L-15889]